MGVSANLRRLIDIAGPYWAGEAEVFRTYWDSPKRTRETDRTWLAYQCAKEIWGSGLAPFDKGMILDWAERLVAAFPKVDQGVDRAEFLDTAEGLWAEFAHYCAFADAYDGLALPGEPRMNPAAVKTVWLAWKEDIALSELRLAHRRDYPRLGQRATHFTEGGYCTLFSEGMKLKDRTTGPHGRANELIARACARVYDDEFGHMLKGVVGLDDENLAPEDWRTLEELSILQLKGRIRMRNAQFGHPLSEARVQEIYSGALPPIPFDYAKAEARLAA